MLSIPTLQNIYQKDYRDLFRSNKVANWSTRTVVKGNTQFKYDVIRRVIVEELSKTTVELKKETMDSFLFEHLYYMNLNYQFTYRFNDFVFNSENTIHQVEEFFSKQGELRFNSNLVDTELDSDLTYLKPCTTRIDVIDGKLSTVHMLIKIGDVATRRYSKQNVFIGICIDLRTALIQIKFNLNQLEKLPKEPLKILKEIKDMLNGFGIRGKTFAPLRLNIVSLNEKAARICVFEMFKELSLEAEHILNVHTPIGTEEKIHQFLKSMELKHITEDYIHQIKAVIYQEISNTIRDSTFDKGWVFRFVFKEGLTTRASSRTDDSGPIYGSKVYWHLKELIFKENELYEAGFSWYLPWKTNKGDDDFVQVRLESRNESLIVHYYRNMSFRRREKENYVLQQINKHLR